MALYGVSQEGRERREGRGGAFRGLEATSFVTDTATGERHEEKYDDA
jgi:hypothetical protein